LKQLYRPKYIFNPLAPLAHTDRQSQVIGDVRWLEGIVSSGAMPRTAQGSRISGQTVRIISSLPIGRRTRRTFLELRILQPYWALARWAISMDCRT
jgi:hypothetical protein